AGDTMWTFGRAGGDDAAAGNTRASSWRSLARVNEVDLEPGDRILLEGRATFDGRLVIGPEDAGTRRRPVTVRSFGGGRATIDGGTGSGLLRYNAGRVSPSGAVLVRRGSGSGHRGGGRRDAGNRGDGISFYSDVAVPGTRFDYARVTNVEVSGFGGVGLVLGGYATDALGRPVKTGFSDVRFVRVDAHDNADAGILTYGSFASNAVGWAHANVKVVHCASHANPGIP